MIVLALIQKNKQMKTKNLISKSRNFIFITPKIDTFTQSVKHRHKNDSHKCIVYIWTEIIWKKILCFQEERKM